MKTRKGMIVPCAVPIYTPIPQPGFIYAVKRQRALLSIRLNALHHLPLSSLGRAPQSMERGKNCGDVGAIGIHLEKPEKAVILRPEDDPTLIGRVGTHWTRRS
jgi:hypothetical protein